MKLSTRRVMYSKHCRSAIFTGLSVFLATYTIQLCGCLWSTTRDINVLEEKQPASPFGYYKLDIEGGGGKNSDELTFRCYLQLINDALDTTLIDTIPKLAVDSFRLESNCLPSPAIYRAIERSWSMTNTPGLYQKTPLREDLYVLRGKIEPVHYYEIEGDTVYLPVACNDTDVTVIVYARLFDRLSGKMISNEAKPVQIRVKNDTGLDIGY